ncbi:MAG: response regulator [Candidatus Nitrosotalea sp.]|nr:response regulator [Candidatus Nitrosotalea sp.]
MVNVMVVDDSDAIRMVLKDILVIGQHKLVAELASGIGALEEYTKTKPDIVLLDMAMPKKDGLTALKEIIAYDPKAKVIMISASDNQETVKECTKAGASTYVLKPFNFQEVLKIINSVTKSQSR